MANSIFQLVPAAGGWRLLDNGRPAFWFPEMNGALETAKVMADARAAFGGEQASIQTIGKKKEFIVFHYKLLVMVNQKMNIPKLHILK